MKTIIAIVVSALAFWIMNAGTNIDKEVFCSTPGITCISFSEGNVLAFLVTSVLVLTVIARINWFNHREDKDIHR